MSNGVSVIVPTFNRSSLLKETLDSLLSQTTQPAEIIVVDDCSPDDTLELLASYGTHVRVIEKEANRGKAHSINLAFSHCQHPLIWIVDDDDLVKADAMETLVGALDRDPQAGFAYGRHTRFTKDAAGKFTDLGTGYWTTCSADELLVRTLEDFFVHQPGMIVRRSVVEEVGPLNEELIRSQDYEFLIRLARTTKSVGTDDIVFYQRQHDGIRGTKDSSFSAAQRDQKWIDYDQTIFQQLHNDMPLNEYLPGKQRIASPEDQRRALMQRGVILARKKLWDLALADFRVAASLSSNKLVEDEVVTLKRAFSSKYGCDEILNRSFPLAEFSKLDTAGPAGLTIRQALASGLQWRIRNAIEGAELSKAMRYFWVYSRIRFNI